MNTTTRYILIGGSWKEDNNEATDWQKHMVSTADTPAKILICLFSREQSLWPERFDRITRLFRDNLGSDLLCELALSEHFIAQIKTNPVIYIDEGKNVILEKAFSAYEDLASAFQGKTIAGSSAGANVLSQAYYTRSLHMVRSGLGIIPAKVMTHFGSQPNPSKSIDWEAAKRQLAKHQPQGLPIYTLREGKFMEL